MPMASLCVSLTCLLLSWMFPVTENAAKSRWSLPVNLSSFCESHLSECHHYPLGDLRQESGNQPRRILHSPYLIRQHLPLAVFLKYFSNLFYLSLHCYSLNPGLLSSCLDYCKSILVKHMLCLGFGSRLHCSLALLCWTTYPLPFLSLFA